LGCLRLWGREGVILAIALSALWEGFYRAVDNKVFMRESAEKDLCACLFYRKPRADFFGKVFSLFGRMHEILKDV